jgi:transcriptional regulator with XRE-family HTH domain
MPTTRKGPKTRRVTLGSRLAQVRRGAGLTQEAAATLASVSTPALIKIEGGRRLPGDKTLDRMTGAFVEAGIIKLRQRKALLEELLMRKYAEHRTSPFLRRLARIQLAERMKEE